MHQFSKSRKGAMGTDGLDKLILKTLTIKIRLNHIFFVNKKKL